MSDIEPLILDLLEWLDTKPRRYLDVMDAWRTSCPRLSIWEECMDRGFVAREGASLTDVFVNLTDEGRSFLRSHRAQIVNQAGAAANSTALL
jgi:hypothetical protein